MKDSPQSKPAFLKTRIPHLYRHNSGIFYSRLTIDGKRQYRSLGTDLKSVAVNLLHKEIQRNRGSTSTPATLKQSGAPVTFRDCLELCRSRLFLATNLEETTKVFYELGFKDVEKLWPLMEQKPKEATVDDVLRFLNARLATRFIPMGAKRAVFAGRKSASSTTHNRALKALRSILDIAEEFKLIEKNVARQKTIHQMSQDPKQVKLPNRENYRKLLNHLRTSPQPKHQEAANFIEFMSCTGGRLGGVNGLRWKNIHDGCVYFYEGEVEVCKVPLTEDAQRLIDRLKEVRTETNADGSLFTLRECQKSIDTACREVGIARLTHHDFRHLFATRCIESGVDIPTVSRWLGHKDGGALCMKVYGHLLDQHSREMARKVCF